MTKNVGWLGFLLVAVVLVGGILFLMFGGSFADDGRISEAEVMPKVKHTKRVAAQNFQARKATADRVFEPTHRQVDRFYPSVDGDRVYLQTFCLAPNGNIWACVGGPYMYLTAEEDFIKWEQKSPPMIQVYSPELELLRQTNLPFTPTAINYDSDQDIFYVGGEGQLAKIDRQGKVSKVVDSPNIGNRETIAKEIRGRMEGDIDELQTMRKRQLRQVNEKLKPLVEKQNRESLTEREQKQLETFKKLKLDAQQHLRELESGAVTDEDIERTIRDRMAIKSIAIADDFLFIGVLASDNYSYEVFRVSKEFKEPKRVLDHMRGCCGQFDVKATGNDFWVAENIKLRVVKYDSEGKRLDSFGHASRTEQHGFDSCCNPMNIRVFENGEILTGESSVGHIKRFSPEGKLVAYIGKAKVAIGCKNVAIGFDRVRDIYYMLHQDEHAICILRPKN